MMMSISISRSPSTDFSLRATLPNKIAAFKNGPSSFSIESTNFLAASKSSELYFGMFGCGTCLTLNSISCGLPLMGFKHLALLDNEYRFFITAKASENLISNLQMIQHHGGIRIITRVRKTICKD